MRAAYRVLALLTAVGVVIQVAAIGLDGFMLNSDARDGVTVDSSYSNLGQSIHQLNGNILAVVVLALLVVSFFADVPSGRKLAAVVFGLVVLQIALAVLASGAPVLGILHGINGLAIAGVASMAARRASNAPALATSG
ncbi:hypothetical protein [Kribbella deserti]|uniref:Uncharacterized protein n=1 Tax=Kribbella deserti TaxID=1926257 RepID=A0ABV6QRA5_9ACTN